MIIYTHPACLGHDPGPEHPERPARLEVILAGLREAHGDLDWKEAPLAKLGDLRRVHTDPLLQEVTQSDFDGYRMLDADTVMCRESRAAALRAAGAAVAAVDAVMHGADRTAFCAVRPPGHHATADTAMGFCLLNNIAVAIRDAQAHGLARRIAVVDWDVHHGNGTEAIFLSDPEVLTISLHQDRNYPLDTGGADERGQGKGFGFNLNIPLPPGTGHDNYLEAMERLVLPALHRFRPDAIIVACGYDASAVDPLGRMLLTAETFRLMTRRVKQAAADLCNGRLLLVHEGGYSEVHVPFCGHAVLEELSGSAIRAPDPLAATLEKRQPDARFDAFAKAWIDEAAVTLGL